jgi:predicted SnoaL-like aldol condensation-catalyzing enzyme
MSRVPGRTPRDIKTEWVNAPSLTLINGPYSVMMWDRTAKDPDDPNREYKWNHFDVVRIDSLIKEHWDEARINPPASAPAR